MKISNYTTNIIIVALLLNLVPLTSFSQISYLGETFQYQDGTYGLVGATGICFSPDKKFIYAGAQNTLSVFSYDSVTGNTTFLKAYKNQDDGISGIYGCTNLAISPDGRFLYVTSSFKGTVALFERSIETGLLNFITTFNNNDNNIQWFNNVFALDITANGKFIYFTTNDGEILAYSRDTVTGYITFLQTIHEHNPGGLLWPESVRLSNDNRFLYASASVFENAVSVFKVNEETGLLTFVQKKVNGESPPASIAIEISHDDAFLYLLSENRLSVFTRNIQDGTITFKENITNKAGRTQGMSGSYSLTVSPDDKNIYTISSGDTSFVTFSRNPATNEFRFVNAQPFLSKELASWPYTSKAMICDNHFVFGSGYWNSAMYKTKRDTETGILTLDEKLYFGQNSNIDGLYNAQSSSSSDHHVFVSTPRNGISIFRRNDTTGRLTYKRVINQDNSGIRFLYAVSKSIVSANNQYLYVLATNNGPEYYKTAILIFQIDEAHDNLILLDSVTSDLNGLSDFHYQTDMEMSPDNKFIYVSTSSYPGRIFQFKLNAQTGLLTYVNNFVFPGVYNNYFERLTISNQYIFVTSRYPYNLIMLKRDTVSGSLSLAGSWKTIPGFNHIQKVNDMDVSSDGNNLYLVDDEYQLLANYKIDKLRDTLQFLQVFSYDNDHIDGLKMINGVKVRNDGTFVFTSSTGNSSIGLYYRSPADGFLTYIYDFTEPENNFDGLDGITSIQISRKDRNLYVTSDKEEAIACYKIDLYLGPDITICSGDTAILNAGQGYEIYSWSTGDTTMKIKATKQGWYVVNTVDRFGFTDSDSLYLTVLPSPTPNLGPDINVCDGETVTINANPGENESVLWNTGSTNDTITTTQNGIYWVRLTNNDGCSNSDTILVNYHPIPYINLGHDITIQPDDSVIIVADYDKNNSCLWFNGSTDSIVEINSNMFSSDTLTVWAEVTSPYSCKNRDKVVVTIDSTTYLLTSTITVSPNPTSDYIWVKSNHYISEISCYNMFGQFMFEKEPNLRAVKLDFKFLAMGTFFLKIKLDNDYLKIYKVERVTP